MLSLSDEVRDRLCGGRVGVVGCYAPDEEVPEDFCCQHGQQEHSGDVDVMVHDTPSVPGA